jgi:predicted LPLAT superfamily acyltransferase
MSDANPVRQAVWAQQQERSNMTLLRLMTWIALRLGRGAARVVLLGISLYFLLFARSARQASRAYLRRVLGRPPRVRDIFRHFHCFAACILDRVYLLNERFGLFRIEVHGEAAIQPIIASGRGAILIGAHIGSFEVARAVGRRQPDLRVAMVMYEANARKINAALAAINPSAVQDIVPLGQLDSMLQVRERLEQGTLLGVLADRTLDRDATLRVPFLGDPAELPLGPMRLAAMLKCPVLFMCGLYLGGNRYAIQFEPLADFSDVERATRDAAIREATQAYAACLERYCRAQPYNWFNFFDFWRESAAGKQA